MVFYNCNFRYTEPFIEDEELQSYCDHSRDTMILCLLFIPVVYFLILYIEKNYIKTKSSKK